MKEAKPIKLFATTLELLAENARLKRILKAEKAENHWLKQQQAMLESDRLGSLCDLQGLENQNLNSILGKLDKWETKTMSN